LARFEALAKPMSAAVFGYSRKIQNLRQTRDLLLPRLLSGQVELPEWGDFRGTACFNTC
jgi:type I restriction enzyme S subunit